MKGRIPRSFIQEVLARTDIVEIIQTRVKLTKRGQNHVACCPFHTEKTPSFTVSSTKQFYYCFGCGAHGNVISFLIAYDRMEFVDTITYLASQLGLEVPYEGISKEQESYQAFYPLLDQVAKFYQQQLKGSSAAIEYLKSRGLTGETAKFFRIGYVPSAWENLRGITAKNPSYKAMLIRNGLLIEKNNSNVYDRFRNRIMFPIRDYRGRVIAFGGRAIGDDQPKYMNSPETPVFHKSNELYGLYEALQQNRKLEQVLIVEGYMDVISLAQHGITYAVATLGTATNPKHLQKIFRFSKRVIFCFDGDNAGRQAAWKAIGMSLPLLRDGIDICFLFLPNNEDPDSLVRKIGQAKFTELVTKATSLGDLFFTELQSRLPIDTAAHKAEFTKEALRYLNTMPHGIFQQLLYQRLSQLLKIDIADLQQYRKSTPPHTLPKKSRQPKLLLAPTQRMISLLLQKPNLCQHLKDLSFLDQYQDPDKHLLMKLLHVLKSQPNLTLGAILASWDDSPEQQQQLANLAARELLIPLEGLEKELLGASARLRESANAQLLENLIEKAKISPLSSNEKAQLQSLLADKANSA